MAHVWRSAIVNCSVGDVCYCVIKTSRDCNPGIPAEFSNPRIQGLAAFVCVTIYLLFSVSCLYKLVYSVNFTSKLPTGVPDVIIRVNVGWGNQFLTEIVDHTNRGAEPRSPGGPWTTDPPLFQVWGPHVALHPFLFVVFTCAQSVAVEHVWVQLLLNLTTYRARLGVLVLVVYLKPEAENTRNLTNKTT